MEMIIAIVVHKGAAGSALGISLVKSFPNDFRLVRQLIFIFAIATPIGVIIGMLCTNAGDLVDVIMSSLAGGTFIYIGCTEIVVSEFAPGTGYKVHKFIAYLCGAALITSLCFMAGA
jgi:zinc transporter ZupT